MTDRDAMQMALEIIGTHHVSFKHETTTLREALEMALEIIENHSVDYENQIIAIRKKLEQQIHTIPADTHQLNTKSQRQWSSLTSEEILDLFDVNNVYGSKWVEFARAVEAKLKEKNHDTPT